MRVWTIQDENGHYEDRQMLVERTGPEGSVCFPPRAASKWFLADVRNVCSRPFIAINS